MAALASAVILPQMFGRKPLEQMNLEKPYEMLDRILRLHLDRGLGAVAIARLLHVDAAVARDVL